MTSSGSPHPECRRRRSLPSPGASSLALARTAGSCQSGLWASLGLTRQGLPEQLPRGQLGDGDASGWTRCGGTWQVENPFYGEYSGQDGGTQLSLWSQSMTSGRVGAAVIAQAGLELQYNGYLVFDYADASNYKYAGMDGTGQRWVIREVVSDTDTLRASVAGTIVKGTLYDVEVQVSGNLATLKVGGVVKTSYTFGGIQGGQVGLRIAQAHTHFKEVYLRAFSQVTKYYTFGGRRIAMRRDHILFFLAADHLGTTSVVLDAAGNVVDESRHYPYGTERWPVDSAFPTECRFTGQLLDSPLGLYHMGARWYDPALARWLSADTIVPTPANPQSLSRYSYVLGNPLGLIDPSGHHECSPTGACSEDSEDGFQPGDILLEDTGNWAIPGEWDHGSVIVFTDPDNPNHVWIVEADSTEGVRIVGLDLSQLRQGASADAYEAQGFDITGRTQAQQRALQLQASAYPGQPPAYTMLALAHSLTPILGAEIVNSPNTWFVAQWQAR